MPPRAGGVNAGAARLVRKVTTGSEFRRCAEVIGFNIPLSVLRVQAFPVGLRASPVGFVGTGRAVVNRACAAVPALRAFIPDAGAGLGGAGVGGMPERAESATAFSRSRASAGAGACRRSCRRICGMHAG